MPQSSCEAVRRAIEFDNPDRLPFHYEWRGHNDVCHVCLHQIIGAGDQEKAVDEWGCVWERTEVENMGIVTGHPLLDLTKMDQFPWPDPHDPFLYEWIDKQLAKAGDRYVTSGIAMLLFERMYSLHGFEETLLDLAADPTAMEELADRIIAYDLAVIEHLSSTWPGRIHGFTFSDDWGSEAATFISPALWRKVFLPRYDRVFRAAHEAGWHVWMHTCGRVNEIIEPLIEIGLDVINLQQPRTLGIEEIGRRFRGRICFESLCDIQKTLPSNDVRAVEEEARLLLEHWAAPEGGFILSDCDARAVGAQPETRDAMFEAFLRLQGEVHPFV